MSTTLSTKRSVYQLSAAIVAGTILFAACGTTVRGATEANLAKAQQQAPKGAEVFRGLCAECHGARGEGTQVAPDIMGPDALPVRRQKQIDSALLADPAVRNEQERTTVPGSAAGKDLRLPFNTAKDIFTYLTTTHTRVKDVKALTPEQVWEALNFVLAGHGVSVPAGGLNEANAASVVNQAQ